MITRMYIYIQQDLISLRNIKGQDWKYALFVIFISYSQHIQRLSAMGGD